MKRTLAWAVLVLVIAGFAGFMTLTSPTLWRMTHPSRDVADDTPGNIENGRLLFTAGACAICHATPKQKNEDLLGGGYRLDTAFGTFYTPNISPDPVDGIGAWTTQQFVTAMREGISPHGEIYYPAFPFTSYQRMTANDLKDLLAYLKTLPPVHGKAPPHDLKFPFDIRRSVGAWHLLFLDGKPLPPAPSQSPLWLRGRYLVEGPAHCAECHSPRNFLGGVIASKRYAGGYSPDGKEYIPNITPDETGIGYWSVNEIVQYLHTGISPIGMHAGGDMAAIIREDTSRLPPRDLLAMATYLKTLPAVDAPAPGEPEPNRTDHVIVLPRPAQSDSSAALNALAAPASQLASLKTAYVVTTRPFYLDQAALGASQAPAGKLLGAARLTVLQSSGNAMQVRLDGWRQQGSDKVFYALPGQRIMQAVLGDDAVRQVKKGRTVTDAGSGQQWTAASLTVWIQAAGLAGDAQTLWTYNGKLFAQTCSACHAVPQTNAYLANQWVGTLKAMKPYTTMSDDTYRLLLAYLQYHAKDVQPGAAAQP